MTCGKLSGFFQDDCPFCQFVRKQSFFEEIIFEEVPRLTNCEGDNKIVPAPEWRNGRRSGLKIRRARGLWEFESPLRHHFSKIKGFSTF